MDHLISQYIDNELSLKEKGYFVERISKDPKFREETFSLLELQQLIALELNRSPPANTRYHVPFNRLKKVVGLALAASLVCLLSFSAGINVAPDSGNEQLLAQAQVNPYRHRFVIYLEAPGGVEISGSFTNWQNIPMQRQGESGYWEITLPLSSGEHKYVFLINGTTPLPDPTVLTREKDGFGAVNTIINV